MKVNDRVKLLREEMKKNGLSAWIVNGTDPHKSEYVKIGRASCRERV